MPTLPNPAPGGAFRAGCLDCGRPTAIPTGQDHCPQCVPGTPRCGAAHPDDHRDCDGPPDAVRLVDRTGEAVLGCVRHAVVVVVVLASVTGVRVEPARVPGAAIQVWRRAQGLAPFEITGTITATDQPRPGPTCRGRAARVGRSRLAPGRLLAAARSSAALLRQLAPDRRDLCVVQEICCPLCHTWVSPDGSYRR